MKRHALQFTAATLLAATVSACSSTPKIDSEPAFEERPVQSAPLEFTTTSRGPMLTLDDVLFDFEESSLRAEAKPIIEQAADWLKDNPGRVALVEGHTDHTGDANYNGMLSEARAQSVRDALLEAGAPVRRVEARGYGEARPVASNRTLEGRQLNRRVEIVFKRDNGI